MTPDIQEEAASGAKKPQCNLWTFTLNTGRRLKVLGRYSQACWQQSQIKRAERTLGEKTFQALEQGEANPLAAPEVNEALQKVKEAKERKEKTYQVIAAIREQIRASCVMPPPEEPVRYEENPPP
jgi:hypothetical protein